MSFIWDSVFLLNMVLCFMILVVSYLAYRKTNDILFFYLAFAHGLFAITHFLSLVKFNVVWEKESLLIFLRAIGYLIVIFSIAAVAFRKDSK